MHRALAGVVGRGQLRCWHAAPYIAAWGASAALARERRLAGSPRLTCKLLPLAANSGSAFRLEVPAAGCTTKHRSHGVTDSLAKPEQEVDQHCGRRRRSSTHISGSRWLNMGVQPSRWAWRMTSPRQAPLGAGTDARNASNNKRSATPGKKIGMQHQEHHCRQARN